MLNSLDTQMLVVLFMIVAVGSFFIGSMMNGVLEEDGGVNLSPRIILRD